MFLDRDDRPIDLVDLEEMASEDHPEVLDRPRQVLAGERVDRVLHRVGRDDVRVVAVDVRSRELAFERDRDGQVADLVAIRARTTLTSRMPDLP